MDTQSPETYSGEDAKDQDGGLEYKSTIGKNISGTYNGISVRNLGRARALSQRGQDRQVPKSLHDTMVQGLLKFEVNCEDVLSILLPKVKKQFEKNQNTTKKDPRLGATISKRNSFTRN